MYRNRLCIPREWSFSFAIVPAPGATVYKGIVFLLKIDSEGKSTEHTFFGVDMMNKIDEQQLMKKREDEEIARGLSGDLGPAR